MRKTLIVCVLLELAYAANAAAGDLSLSGGVAYDERRFDESVRSGIEQGFNIGWQRTFFTPISLRLLFRGDDFRGTLAASGAEEDTHTRRLQPQGELSYTVSNFSASLRHDYIGTRFERAAETADSSTERTSLTSSWARERFPVLSFSGQRQRVVQPSRTVADETASASVSYSIGGLEVAASSQRGRAEDAFAGYERQTSTSSGLLNWGGRFLDDRFNLRLSGAANLSNHDQRALNPAGTRLPFPVAIARALFAIDETPLDGRDRGLTAIPALIDGSLNTPAGISFGPDGASFQNLVVDLGRTESLDEIRLVVRDERGDPVRRIGLVSFDVYTSVDGLLWEPLNGSSTSWDSAVSYYAVTFESTRSRWFKIVTFGVNPEPVLLTELQAFYHRTLSAGQDRETRQRLYTGEAGFTATPVRRLRLHYATTYNSISVDDASSIARTQNDLQHQVGADLAFGRGVTVGALATNHNADATGQTDESDRTMNAFIRASPSRRLDLALDFTRSDSERSYETSTIDTVTFHSRVRVMRAVSVGLDAGVDTLQSSSSASRNRRRFIELSTEAQLYPMLRLLVAVTSQRTSVPTSVNIPLLGRQDDRAYADVSWTPSSLLMARARFGWVSGLDRSAITQQYFVDWNPLKGGSIVIGGSHEEDFDPYMNRRASRTTLRPRWSINNFTTLDINYFSFTTVLGDVTSRQQTIHASVNLTRK